MDGLQIKLTSVGSNERIILTAKEGYKINDNLLMIESNEFTIQEVPTNPRELTQEIASSFFGLGGK